MQMDDVFQDPSHDPWCNYQTRGFSKFVKTARNDNSDSTACGRNCSQPTLVLTVKHASGTVINFFDRNEARHFAEALKGSLCDSIRLHGNARGPVDLDVSNDKGQGWRTKAAIKKAAKLAGAELQVEDETRARMFAIEPTIRAQVEAQIQSGMAPYNAKGLVPPQIIAWRNVAEHNFHNDKPFDQTNLQEHKQQVRGGKHRVVKGMVLDCGNEQSIDAEDDVEAKKKKTKQVEGSHDGEQPKAILMHVGQSKGKEYTVEDITVNGMPERAVEGLDAHVVRKSIAVVPEGLVQLRWHSSDGWQPWQSGKMNVLAGLLFFNGAKQRSMADLQVPPEQVSASTVLLRFGPQDWCEVKLEEL